MSSQRYDHDDSEIVPQAENTAAYPDDNPKTVFGLAKPGLSAIPPVALLELGRAMECGRRKYGLMNWRGKRVSSSVYYDAALRHLLAWWDGEDIAADSHILHLSHAMACLSILIDANVSGALNDDRPMPGTAADLIAVLTGEVSE
ncbi:MAG: DUF5664 domain-containing protein [Hyphomicrobiales bacterium]|nr:DUF5664 domain-containing protein [Hyphomicrobiales bacterium]